MLLGRVRGFAFVLAILLCIVSSFSNAVGQSAAGKTGADSRKAGAKKDLSKEPAIIESLRSTVRYENDGTGAKSAFARVRVQSEPGVQQFGTIRFGYSTAFENIEIEFLRVTKPDGSKVVASVDSVQDVPSAIQQIAPEYTDYREKIVSVPGLRPGDILEYSVRTAIHSALVPGHFFEEYTFEKKSPILEERLEIDLPTERKVTTKFSPEFQPSTKTEGQRMTYVWTHSTQGEDDETEDEQSEVEQESIPDVQISTFQSWPELAAWYAGLETPRAVADEAIRRKATELTASARTEEEKVRRLYNYVATNIRYLGLSFGVGRYQPHAAAEVFAHQYGDCKDKHTLLAAMLDSIGVKSDPVLINSVKKLDEAVPSPLQFNHLITAIPQGSSYLYVDTTTEVAPMGALFQPLRGKKALRVGGEGQAEIVGIPTEAAYPSRERSEVDAKVNDNGDLSAKIKFTATGDAEVVWRLLLRRIPEPQWPDMLKGIIPEAVSEAEISNIVCSGPSDLSKSFEVSFDITKKGYIGDVSASVPAKLPIISLMLRPAAKPNEKKGPIRLGKQEVSRHLRLQLPSDISAAVPSAVSSKQDFVEYEARYRVEKNVLFADRTYRVTQDEVPRARYEDYNKVYGEANSDQEKTAYVYRNGWRRDAGPIRTTVRRNAAPDVRSSEQLLAAARTALASGNLAEGRTLLQRVVAKDPRNSEGWVALGSVHMRTAAFGEAAVAFQKVVELEPTRFEGWAMLGQAYNLDGRASEAADAFKKAQQVQGADLPPGFNSMLGWALMAANRPAEAIEPLKRAAEEDQDAGIPVQLAKAYFLTKQIDEGRHMVDSFLEGEPSPTRRAQVAEMLAEVEALPDVAEQQANLALTAAYDTLQQTPELAQAEDAEFERTWKLTRIWLSVGQVYSHQGNLQRAQRYLEAAWAWGQQLGSGDPLAQLYLKQGRRDEAIRVWAQANGRTMAKHPEPWKRFVDAVGDAKKAEALVAQHRLDLQEMRTLQIPNQKKMSGSAEFAILVGQGSKVESAARVSGDERLSGMSPELLKLRPELPFPDEQPIHVLRKGIMSCFNAAPTCMFVLLPEPNAQMLSPGF